MGRSPLLATKTRAARRPALISISAGDSANRYSPGCILCDGVMYGHQLRAIGEGRLHLDLMDHFRYAVHDVFALEDCGAVHHDFGHALTVSRRLQYLRG